MPLLFSVLISCSPAIEVGAGADDSQDAELDEINADLAGPSIYSTAPLLVRTIEGWEYRMDPHLSAPGLIRAEIDVTRAPPGMANLSIFYGHHRGTFSHEDAIHEPIWRNQIAGRIAPELEVEWHAFFEVPSDMETITESYLCGGEIMRPADNINISSKFYFNSLYLDGGPYLKCLQYPTSSYMDDNGDNMVEHLELGNNSNRPIDETVADRWVAAAEAGEIGPPVFVAITEDPLENQSPFADLRICAVFFYPDGTVDFRAKDEAGINRGEGTSEKPIFCGLHPDG